MKRTLFLLIAAIGIVAISTGCSSGETQVVENKNSQLEQQLNSQDAQSSNSVTTSSNSSSQNNNSQQSNTNFDTTELSKKVDAVVQLADSTQPKSTLSENINLYGQVNMQIEKVDFELEQFENQIEMAWRTGTLSSDQYYQLDRTLDQLDQRLDMSKDSLEYRLGVDD